MFLGDSSEILDDKLLTPVEKILYDFQPVLSDNLENGVQTRMLSTRSNQINVIQMLYVWLLVSSSEFFMWEINLSSYSQCWYVLWCCGYGSFLESRSFRIFAHLHVHLCCVFPFSGS